MAGLPVLKKCEKIRNVVSSSDFEIFSPEIHALKSQVFIIWAFFGEKNGRDFFLNITFVHCCMHIKCVNVSQPLE